MRRWSKNAFTLMELMVVVIIIGILATFAVTSYAGYRDRVAVQADLNNQQILHAAVRMYASDEGEVPDSLSRLRPEDLERAYASVSRRRPRTALASISRWWDRWFGVRAAEAFFDRDYFGRDLRVLVCLSDPTPPTGFGNNGQPTGGTSYQINQTVTNPDLWTLAKLIDPANGGTVLIFESDGSNQLSAEVKRHRGGTVGVRTLVNGRQLLQ